jgi:hypothetical protein
MKYPMESHNKEEQVQIAAEALRRVFGENEDAKRFIDITRIPMICKSIIDIHQNIALMKQQLKMITWVGGIIGAATIAGFIEMVFR